MEGRAGESGESSRPVVAVVREAGNPVMTASAAPHESGEEGAAGFGAAEHFQQGAPPGFAAFAYEQAGQQQQQQLYHMLHPPSDERLGRSQQSAIRIDKTFFPSPYDRVTPPAPDHHHQGYSQQQLAPPPQSSSSQLVFDGFQGVQGGAAGQSGTLGPVRAGGSLVNFGKIVQNRCGNYEKNHRLEPNLNCWEPQKWDGRGLGQAGEEEGEEQDRGHQVQDEEAGEDQQPGYASI